ncbi:Rieske (2Fe-2S) protein [Streptomyces sp. NBC_00289]|uniref:Rieske (2Fe-2S) protein n=1 Tax=Streptomyces sp. NBC_00289 TaxID=2975703 RepID=UPI003246343C
MAVAAAVTVLAGCGRQEKEGAVREAAAAAAAELARADEVPRGGGLVVPSANVVLTRGEGGELRAYSAICTHAGCVVAEVSDGKILCPCHGSRFDAVTGRPVHGPATKALPVVKVTERDGVIVKG